MKIFKYNVPAEHIFPLALPKGATVLSFGKKEKEKTLNIWAKVDPEQSTERRWFCLLATGEEFNEEELGLQFIGTACVDVYVWHLFEVGNREFFEEQTQV